MSINRERPVRDTFPRATQFAATMLFFSVFLGTPGLVVEHLRGEHDNAHSYTYSADASDPGAEERTRKAERKDTWIAAIDVAIIILPALCFVIGMTVVTYRVLIRPHETSDVVTLIVGIVILVLSVVLALGPEPFFSTVT